MAAADLHDIAAKHAKSAQNPSPHFSHLMNRYVSDKPIPTPTTTIPPFARKPVFAIAIAANQPCLFWQLATRNWQLKTDN
ncbi:MAG: hypothetical protein K8L97_18010 [Anaerolineae bacterium]|nr:hypothetical protein [Anaerolineae bacterium]